VAFLPQNIYNCDDSELTWVHKLITSGERGQTTTILLAMNAVGGYVPPMMILKRKRMKDSLVDHAPLGTLGKCSGSGWIDTELFMAYIKHFVHIPIAVQPIRFY